MSELNWSEGKCDVKGTVLPWAVSVLENTKEMLTSVLLSFKLVLIEVNFEHNLK